VADELRRLPVAPLRLAGSGSPMLLPLLRGFEFEVPDVSVDAAVVALTAEAMAGRGDAPSAAGSLTPLYLRDADARPDAGRALLEVGG
jgi:hypothetical protein